MTAPATATPSRGTVLMDLDGTISDPAGGVYASFRHALEQVGRPWPDDQPLAWIIGPPLRESFMLLLDDPEKTAQALQHYRTHYAAGALYDNRLYTGMAEAIAALAADGFRLFVATSKLVSFAEKIVQRFGLAPRFERVYGSTLDGRIDQKGDIIAMCLGTEDIDPETCIMVGDREHDVNGARANGLDCIGVTWGFGSRDELIAAQALALCERPADLVGLVCEVIDARTPAATSEA
ncbi:HAD hydrolase-like protein [Rhodoplanes roseus]|uniref:HAD hydrolase-like protein n=1 Tax=Rhodoplanes roseus TaxID=29409 RepID=UPI0014741044|nr:HAD hydrolase-like protein [Rhodoplanes roseus]